MSYTTEEEIDQAIWEFENLIDKMVEEREKKVPSLSRFKELHEKMGEKLPRIEKLEDG